ncbi:YcxB family protein [Actinoplanes friuliensis]|uniref:YcxB-like C-terminal domain-containing protein n=1 Tax=Actinoplanes friuliensis DSM 7358 TaxID=1246995 RepID=U5VPF5_9ACTN|nr:YcxB family protein [Actinoplanes friuliensis]AGZ38684.1 hypothetical protein AFR_01975 [Actinoplanes friuliensis DSM 7358]
MEIRVERAFDEQQTLANLRAAYADALRLQRSVGTTVAVVFAVLAVLLLVFSDATGLAFILLVVVAAGLFYRGLGDRKLRAMTAKLPALVRQVQVITLTSSRVRAEYPLMSVEIAWEAFEKFVETDTAWLLFYGGDQFLAVPKTGLTADKSDEFRKFLSGRFPALPVT